MKLSLDCLPCLLRQSLEAARMVTVDDEDRHQIMTAALEILSRYRNYGTSPQLARDIHRMIRELTGCADPYSALKTEHIGAALSLYDEIRSVVLDSPDPLLTAIKAAAIGNIIDAAIITDIQIEQTILTQLSKPLAHCDIDERARAAIAGGNLLRLLRKVVLS